METINLPALNNAEEKKEAEEGKDAMLPTKSVMEIAEWVTALTKWEI